MHYSKGSRGIPGTQEAVNKDASVVENLWSRQERRTLVAGRASWFVRKKRNMRELLEVH